MVASKRNQKQGLNTLLKAAMDLHGHFGPFLTLGVRIGLVGIRELEVKEGDTQLHVTVMLEYALPFSCILDGVQTATKCTVGNKRLTWRESKEIGAIFELQNSGRQIEVSVNSDMVQELSLRLDKKPSDKELQELALDIGSRSERELFSVTHK
jgi:formylmethanofuran dehydrogenase subunit E